MRVTWTPVLDTALEGAAFGATSVQDACARFEAMTGYPITRDAADKRLARRGRESLGALIRAKATPETTEIPIEWCDDEQRTDPQIVAPAFGSPVHASDLVDAEEEAGERGEVRNGRAQGQEAANGNGARRQREELDDREEHRLRTQLRDVESAKKRLLKDLDDREAQIDALRELRAARPLPPIDRRSVVGGKQRQGVPFMLCSDWHVEEPVERAKVNGLNEYNLDIADKCIDALADGYEWMLRDSRFDCRTGVIWLGGDLYSGYIHAELQESCFLSPVQAVVWLQERIERMLRKIAATTTLERIVVVCNDGNHGRLTMKTRVGTRTANSLEWLLYQTLAARMADDPRFEFQIAEGEYNYLDVFGKTFCFCHGDSFRYMGGVGGLLIPVKRGLNEIRKYRPVDHFALGHFHQRLDLGDIAVNGSLIGIGPYSLSIKASPEAPQQSWFMVDSERGKCLSAPIWMPDRNVSVAA